MPGFKRLPNRYGTITKLSGKRRKPYCARKYAGEVWSDELRKSTIRYVSVGTFATRREALEALTKANEDPNFGRDRITFKELFDKWYAEKKPTISSSMQYTYENAFRWMKPLHDRAIGDLRTDELEAVINSDRVPRTTKGFCKITLNGVYQYAMRHEYIGKNYAELVQVQTDMSPKIERKVFTPEEVQALRDKHRTTDDDVILTMLYTGFRVSEVLAITSANVDLENHLFVNVGMKTDAGKNRTVPIHDDIFSMISEYAPTSSEMPPHALFKYGDDKIPVSAFKWHFSRLYPNHTTHDCRHSFATYAYKQHMDVAIVKLIMGHAVGDITHGRYTHITAEDLRREMQKYRIE